MAKRLEIQLYNAKTGESITLPLNPESTDIPNEKDIRTYDILGFGEVSVKGTQRLKRINLSHILPESNSTLALLASLVQKLQHRPYNLQETINMINRWVNQDMIIRLIISDKLNQEFRIEKFKETVRESVATAPYAIDLVEYRDPAQKENILKKNEMGACVMKLKKRAINKFIPNQQVAQAGMTIYKLAKLTYGGRSQELANLNAIYNQNAVITGQVVEMLPI